MGFDRVRKLGLELTDVEVGTTYGSPALKVRGKWFACIAIHKSAEPDSLAVRVSFIERDLRLSYEPKTYYMGPHYAGHEVVLVRLSRIGDDALRELLETGVAFVSAKARRRSQRRR
jgi:hypothetical protein